MIKRTITFIFLLCSVYLMAQDSDYLVMRNGDKVSVKIKGLGFTVMTAKVNGKKVKYKPEQNLVKEIYYAKKDKFYYPIILENRSPPNRFLPALINGRIKVFLQSFRDTKDRIHIEYFLSNNGAPLTKIPDVIYNFRSFVNKKNINFFRNYFKDCPTVAAKFTSDTRLSSDELLEIIKKYNSTCPIE